MSNGYDKNEDIKERCYVAVQFYLAGTFVYGLALICILPVSVKILLEIIFWGYVLQINHSR